MSVPALAVVVLAAGRATRLGALKPLVSVGGEPLVARLVRQLRRLGAPVWVVTGHRADEVEAALSMVEADFVRNHSATGLAGSCAVGVHVWPPDRSPRAVLVVLGDNVTEPALFERIVGSAGDLVLGYTDSPLDDEAMKLRVDPTGRPTRLGKDLGPPVIGEFVGVFLARGRGLDHLRAALLAHGPDVDLCDGPLNTMLADGGLDARSVDCGGIPWIEIDFPEDVHRMRSMSWSTHV